MKTSVSTPIEDAVVLLDKGDPNGAIEVLRTGNQNDAYSCALLAHAYFQRGDTKGDVYTSYYFARRARQLGYKEPSIIAIQAVAAFQKEHFEEAIRLFDCFVTEHSLPSTKLVYGVALHKCGKPWDAMVWIDSALEALPDKDPLTAKARKLAQAVRGDLHVETSVSSTQNMFATVIETLKRSNAKQIDAPFKHNALSKLRGYANQPKDFNWVKKSIPCQAACPAGTDVPAYLSAIYQGDYDRAYRINLWDNVFPAVLGRVCARPCESACRHGWPGLGQSVAICWSKRSAADLKSQEPVVLDPLYGPSGKRIAVIGAGVAGLAAARNLSLLGHRVVVFEKHDTPGGMMNQGIPEFRLPRDIIDLEIEQVRRAGVEIRCNVEIGKELSIRSLVEDYEAVIIAAGTLKPNVLELPGNRLAGIRHGLDFLLEVNETQQATGFGQQVIVIGGGFTAMDCARTAWRLGPESVRVMYRRGQSEMLITPGELEELGHEGIPMEFFVSPMAYVGDANGRVRTMRFIRTQLGEPDASGRRRPVEIPGSEFEVPCDTVLLATGQFPDTCWIDEEFHSLLVGEGDWLNTSGSAVTDHARIFVAGDFATGARTLIDAIGHAKECVRRVDRFLMGEERLLEVVEVTDAPQGSGRIREMDRVPRKTIPIIPVETRQLTAEVETGYDEDTSVDEVQRCYMCHYKYEIDIDKCIYCEWCLKAKPRPDCIVRVKELSYDQAGVITGFERAQSTEETKMIYINQEDCIRCNACVDACPVDCISVQKVSIKTITKTGVALY